MGLLSFLRRAGSRPLVVEAFGVSPGDDLVLSPPDWAANEDAVSLLNAVQAKFPGTRIHLLVGFGPIYVSGKQRRQDCEAAGQDAQPKGTVQQRADYAFAAGAQTGPQGNVVLLTHCSGGRVIAVSVPPKQQGDLVAPGVSHTVSGESSDATDSRARG